MHLLYFAIAVNVVSWCLPLVLLCFCTTVYWLSLIFIFHLSYFTIGPFIRIITTRLITWCALVFPYLFHFNNRIFFIFFRGFLIAPLGIKFWRINSVFFFLLGCLWLFQRRCCSLEWKLNPPWFLICLAYWHWFICCIRNVLIRHWSFANSLCFISLSLDSIFILLLLSWALYALNLGGYSFKHFFFLSRRNKRNIFSHDINLNIWCDMLFGVFIWSFSIHCILSDIKRAFWSTFLNCPWCHGRIHNLHGFIRFLFLNTWFAILFLI